MLEGMAEDADRPSLEARVAALEWEVRHLRSEMTRAKSSDDQSPSARAPAPIVEARLEAPPRPLAAPIPEAAPRPSPAPVTTPLLDLETLVGRYGMLGLATLLALAALGTFVSWAIAHGLLGPAVRVALGLVASAAIAVCGLRLRPRSRSFGDSLLGLALAAVHVCAWAAGPSLGLVPAPLALAFSALASVALGAFALVQADEPLWCVGFGGAAIAPFVTSTGRGTAPMLAAYAAAVLVAAGSGLGSRPWFIAGRIFAAGAALFTVALLCMPASQNAPLLALGLPLVAAGFAVLPFARGEVLRPRLRTMGLLAGGAALRLAVAPVPWMGQVGAAIAIGIAGCAWLVLLELTDDEPAGKLVDGMGETLDGVAAWMEGAVVPGLFLGALGIALDLDAAPAFGVASVILLASTKRRSQGVRDALAASTWAAAMLATWLTTRTVPTLAAASLAWASVVVVWLGLWIPSPSWTWTSRISLVIGSLWGLSLVSARPPYEALPFTTLESATAFAVAVAWGAALHAARMDGETSRASARFGLVAFAFLWGHLELDHAISPSASSLLLIGYYAVSSVGFVGWGRLKRSAHLRRLGLGLGIIAAFLAVRGAWRLPEAGARIAAYLVVSVFLLGIAWWYRQPDEEALPAQTLH
ncbi:MAG: hypothetical protein AUI48_07035 [Chloroflexi bacterium 13_1_40CM_2_68_14]|nr:MAG: hypothetical protein AUI48_07035 [Chloroflexi bacterium 13_1_40CM_2_68_14]